VALLSVVDPGALVTDIPVVPKFNTSPVAVSAQELALENFCAGVFVLNAKPTWVVLRKKTFVLFAIVKLWIFIIENPYAVPLIIFERPCELNVAIGIELYTLLMARIVYPIPFEPNSTILMIAHPRPGFLTL
jgi:hypothetical protein